MCVRDAAPFCSIGPPGCHRPHSLRPLQGMGSDGLPPGLIWGPLSSVLWGALWGWSQSWGETPSASRWRAVSGTQRRVGSWVPLPLELLLLSFVLSRHCTCLVLEDLSRAPSLGVIPGPPKISAEQKKSPPPPPPPEFRFL